MCVQKTLDNVVESEVDFKILKESYQCYVYYLDYFILFNNIKHTKDIPRPYFEKTYLYALTQDMFSYCALQNKNVETNI